MVKSVSEALTVFSKARIRILLVLWLKSQKWRVFWRSFSLLHLLWIVRTTLKSREVLIKTTLGLAICLVSRSKSRHIREAMVSNDVENNLSVWMGEEKEILFKVLAVSHHTLAKFCLTPSFLKPRYNHMHSPCNQFMRANGEVIVCSRTRRVEES